MNTQVSSLMLLCLKQCMGFNTYKAAIEFITKSKRERKSQPISQITESILGMFVLILMHFSW